MRITEAEREVLRKNVTNMIQQFKKSKIVNHFKNDHLQHNRTTHV